MITYDKIRNLILEHLGVALSYQIAPGRLDELCNALDDLYDEAWKTAKSEGFADGLQAR